MLSIPDATELKRPGQLWVVTSVFPVAGLNRTTFPYLMRGLPQKQHYHFFKPDSGAFKMLQNLTLYHLTMSFKVLFTGFLLVIGVGLLMAGAQIMLTHGMADGKAGLSIDDIVYSYYGNRSGSKLESMLNGQMKAMAPDAVRFELIEWARDGAKSSEWESQIKPLVDQYCVSCHSGESSLPNFNKQDVFQSVAAVDGGASITSLTRISHIHLFGIAFIFLFVGWIFALAEYTQRWKLILIATPFAFLILDVVSWWLTKFSPVFAWLTMIGGIGYSLASTTMILTSLVQMWIPREHWLSFWENDSESAGTSD